MEQNNLLTDPEVNRLAGNAKVLADRVGLNFELVFERGCYRAKAGGEHLFSVWLRVALINYLSALCDELGLYTTGKRMKQDPPNAIIMAEAFMDEQKAAQQEQREPRSSNVIKLFQQRTKGKRLSDAQAGELFWIVFTEISRITGVSIGRLYGQDIRN